VRAAARRRSDESRRGISPVVGGDALGVESGGRRRIGGLGAEVAKPQFTRDLFRQKGYRPALLCPLIGQDVISQSCDWLDKTHASWEFRSDTGGQARSIDKGGESQCAKSLAGVSRANAGVRPASVSKNATSFPKFVMCCCLVILGYNSAAASARRVRFVFIHTRPHPLYPCLPHLLASHL